MERIDTIEVHAEHMSVKGISQQYIYNTKSGRCRTGAGEGQSCWSDLEAILNVKYRPKALNASSMLADNTIGVPSSVITLIPGKCLPNLYHRDYPT